MFYGMIKVLNILQLNILLNQQRVYFYLGKNTGSIFTCCFLASEECLATVSYVFYCVASRLRIFYYLFPFFLYFSESIALLLTKKYDNSEKAERSG